ncbi:hypothetical protein [Algoriphagus sp. PAP.12]|uniref:hypothetical protein n=1 Tax=Algoriphagus sp. PAP.12 TaxID=2996678 RepID=UPI00227CB0B0|nr:hypothetical protein [Algoriphagus sp. PAP.12]
MTYNAVNNPFTDILENEQLPEIIRKKVIDDIDLINLSLDMADLFMVKAPEAIFTIMDFPLDDPKNDTPPTTDPNTKEDE